MSAPFAMFPGNSWDYPVITHEMVTQEWCGLHRMIEELSLVQARLGTPLENPSDYVLVRELGHQIRNKLHLIQLWAELGMVNKDEILLEQTAV